MKTRSLRIPLVLTWTALSGAAVYASAACSSSSEPTSGDAAPMKDGTPQDTSEDTKAKDRVAMEGSPSDASDAPQNPDAFECEKITDSSILFLDAEGLMNCPDGEMKVPIV